MKNESLEYVANRVVVNYLTIDGEDAVYETIDDDSPYSDDLVLEINTKWRTRDITARDCGDKALLRFKDMRETVTLETNLEGAVVDVGESISVTDEMIGETGEVRIVSGVAVDALENEATIEAYSDPIVLDGYALVDIDDCDDAAALVW